MTSADSQMVLIRLLRETKPAKSSLELETFLSSLTTENKQIIKEIMRISLEAGRMSPRVKFCGLDSRPIDSPSADSQGERT